MATHEWKDVSSWSRSETDRTPKSWEIRLGGILVFVTRHIHYAKDDWVLRCEAFFGDMALESKDIDEAKAEAVRIVRQAAQRVVDDIKLLETNCRGQRKVQA